MHVLLCNVARVCLCEIDQEIALAILEVSRLVTVLTNLAGMLSIFSLIISETKQLIPLRKSFCSYIEKNVELTFFLHLYSIIV